jgi:hypothetical protein
MKMQKIVVSEKAVREMIREALSNNNVDEPVKVSDVVDPSAVLTDPGNENYRPNNPVEFQVAVKALSDDLPADKISDIYEKLVSAANLSKKENEGKMKRKDTQVESLVRAHIRKMLRENFVTEAPAGERGKYFNPDERAIYGKIAKKLGMSTANAAALAKHKFVHPGTKEQYIEDPNIERNIPYDFARRQTAMASDEKDFDKRINNAIDEWLSKLPSNKKRSMEADINAYLSETYPEVYPDGADFSFEDYKGNWELARRDADGAERGVKPFSDYAGFYKSLGKIVRSKFEDIVPARTMKDLYPENPPER